MNNDIDSKLILSHLATAVLLVDEELLVIEVNPACEALFSLGRSKLCNATLQHFIGRSNLDWLRIQSLFSLGGSFAEHQALLVFYNDQHLFADLSFTLVPNQQQPFVLIEIKPVEQQQRIRQEHFRQAQHQVSRDLIRNLAHEIKNPLGGIRGAAQLLQQQLQGVGQENESAESTHMIIEQSDRLSSLVDRLLGSNQLPQLALQNVHLSVEKVLQLVAADNPCDIAFYRDYDPSIPDLLHDADLLQQALLNIVRNAMQALEQQQNKNPVPQIAVMTRIVRQRTINRKRHPMSVQIAVTDNGPGIAPKVRDTLFYPMVTDRHGGQGLGLSIAQSLVELHQGSIEVTSQPGACTFTLLLPVLHHQ